MYIRDHTAIERTTYKLNAAQGVRQIFILRVGAGGPTACDGDKGLG